MKQFAPGAGVVAVAHRDDFDYRRIGTNRAAGVVA
jgi:hypothetical protein